ncbi:MAG: cell division protein FtsQ [Prevotella sp.]|nr:cell division protein FtsQ [Prevotella sp.]
MSPLWKKSAIIIADIALACYLLLAITAFNKPDDQQSVCTQVDVTIEDGMVDGFLGGNEIKEQLQRAKIYPQGQPMKQIDIRKIEETIRQNPFVETVECYKTQGGHVKVSLTQRLPVVRVKAANGDDYYVDAHGEIMPNTRYTSNLLVATGSITRPYAQKRLSRIGKIIVQDEFWQSQIEQLNILDDGTVEMVPRIGDHIVYLGTAANLRQQLDRLEKFYRYGLSVAGWNKYDYISLEFDNQIICKKKNKSKT